MKPLIKKGQTIEYTISGKKLQGKAFRSNPQAVWIEANGGKIMKLHKLRHKIKVVEDLVEGKEETSSGDKTLNDLFEALKK